MVKMAMLGVLRNAAEQYIPEQVRRQSQDIHKVAFQIGLATDARKLYRPDEFEIMNLGGGPGLFSVGCAALGMKRSVLVDDFDDAVNHHYGKSILEIHKKYGVEIHSRDMVAQGLVGIEGQFDAITSFDSMEHWHNSPKKLFHDVVAKLKPGGVFVLNAPNCVSLRKRVTVPLGYGRWSEMEDWYETETFRGHVREPDVESFRYISRDMGLKDTRILGRNFMVFHALGFYGSFLPKIDPLRMFPSLCADIYMIGRKDD